MFENEINKSKVRMYGSRINILQSSNYNGKWGQICSSLKYGGKSILAWPDIHKELVLLNSPNPLNQQKLSTG